MLAMYHANLLNLEPLHLRNVKLVEPQLAM